MTTRVKASYDFPRFFEAVTSLSTKDEDPEVRFRNLVRELEKLHRELARIINLNVGDADWTDVTGFTNSWVNEGSGTYNDAGYMLVGQEIVMLKGAIKSGTVTAAAFNLPAGYRPAKELEFAVTANGAFGELIVQADGDVIPNVGSNTIFSLEGVIFRTNI